MENNPAQSSAAEGLFTREQIRGAASVLITLADREGIKLVKSAAA